MILCVRKSFKSSMSKEGSKRFANSLKTKLTSKFLKSDVNEFVKMAFVIKNIRVRNFITRETREGYFRCLKCYFFFYNFFKKFFKYERGQKFFIYGFLCHNSFILSLRNDRSLYFDFIYIYKCIHLNYYNLQRYDVVFENSPFNLQTIKAVSVKGLYYNIEFLQ